MLLYTRAAHRLGLWKSERLLIERFFPDLAAPLLEAGCGAGRATFGLRELGYSDLTAFDFAEELLTQARDRAAELGHTDIRFHHADATKPSQLRALLPQAQTPIIGPSGPMRPISTGTADRTPSPVDRPLFSGALFLFNGLMQIPGRRNRRRALRALAAVVQPGAPLLFTTHDRDEPDELHLWRAEAKRWAAGTQDPRLHEYGDRYFDHEHGRTFMHLPDRPETLADLAATGWSPEYDAMRNDLARESAAVRDFSDNCRFWLVRRSP
ncbi:MAG: class I SAM-dependent methyltransferase [Opitutaceae bacterium]|nr:class I SAM-dependent methyltransferase [Opitutaceae bacterium]